MILSVVLEQALGSEGVGTVLQLEESAAQALISAGIAREATADDLTPEVEEEEVFEAADEADVAAVADQVKVASAKIENRLIQAAERAAEKQITKTARVKIPAAPKDGTVYGFKSLGEWTQCQVAGRRGDLSALRKSSECNRAVLKNQMSIGGGSGHQGGDLVPIEWAKDLWKLAFNKVPDLLGMSTQYPMQNQTLKIPLWVQPSAATGVVAGVTAEATEITSTVGVTATVSLDLVKFTALVNVTDELERFNSYALDAVLRQIVPQRIRFQVNNSFINGSNSQVNLIGNASTVTLTRSQANRINYADVLAMQAALFDDFVDDSIFLINPATSPEIYSLAYPSRSASTQFPAFTPGNFANQGLLGAKPLGELLGLPIYRSESVPALGAKGDIILYSPKSIAASSTGLIADSTPFLYFNYAENSYRFMWYSSSASLMNVPYTRQNGGTASNIIVLSASSSA